MLLAWIWMSVAWGLRPAPDVRAEVATVLSAAVARAPTADEADALAQRIEDRVGVFPGVRYERALAWNRAGDLQTARAAYDDVIALVPTHAAALYDRGEIALLQGDRSAARRDLEAAVALRPDHWVVYYRLAWLDLDEGKIAAGEDRLLEALRRGMELRMLVDDPGWRALLRQPAPRRAIERMVVVYGSDALLKELEAVP